MHPLSRAPPSSTLPRPSADCVLGQLVGLIARPTPRLAEYMARTTLSSATPSSGLRVPGFANLQSVVHLRLLPPTFEPEWRGASSSRPLSMGGMLPDERTGNSNRAFTAANEAYTNALNALGATVDRPSQTAGRPSAGSDAFGCLRQVGEACCVLREGGTCTVVCQSCI